MSPESKGLRVVAELESVQMDEAVAGPRRPVGYLLGIYPEFEKTFITREVVALRKLGLNVRTCSLRYPPEGQIRTAIEKAEAGKTFYIQKQGLLKIFRDQVVGFLRRPGRYLSALAYTMRVSPPGLRWRTRYLIYFVEGVCLALWAQENGVDFVHVHIANAQCVVAMLARKYSGLRYSVTANGPAIFDDVTELRLTEKFTNADRVVCISDFCRSQVMRWVRPEIWDRLVVVRHGIDPDAFAPGGGEKKTPGKVSLLCVGILWAKKGHHLLLEACGLLKERGLDFECVIVGDGAERESLKGNAKRLGITDCVVFAGAVSEEEIQPFYDAADIGVSSSLAEGIPNVLMEALAKEIPVVAPNIMGIPELVDNGVHGILVSPGNASALADGIETLARDPELRSRMGKEGRKRVVERFNLWTNTAVLAKVIEECQGR